MNPLKSIFHTTLDLAVIQHVGPLPSTRYFADVGPLTATWHSADVRNAAVRHYSATWHFPVAGHVFTRLVSEALAVSASLGAHNRDINA